MRLALAAATTAFAFLAPLLAAPAPLRAEDHEITIGDRAVDPDEIEIEAGDTVTWYNDDDRDHTIVSDKDSDEEFDSGKIAPGESYSHTFKKAGTFKYHCKHVLRLKGKVVVKKNADGNDKKDKDKKERKKDRDERD